MGDTYRDEAVLRRMYWDESMTLDEIAAEFGVVKSTIRNWMDTHGIERRTATESRMRDYEAYRDADVLRDLYWDKGLSCHQIGDRLGVGGKQVHDWMVRHDIPRRGFDEGAARRFSATASVSRDEVGRARLFVSDDGKLRNIPLAKVIALLEYDAETVFAHDIHHVNNCPADDRIENLEPLGHAEHAAHHSRQRS